MKNRNIPFGYRFENGKIITSADEHLDFNDAVFLKLVVDAETPQFTSMPKNRLKYIY